MNSHSSPVSRLFPHVTAKRRGFEKGLTVASWLFELGRP